MNSIIEFSEIQQKKSDLQIEEFGITQIVESLDKNIKDVTGLSDVEFAYGKISSSLKFETDRKIFESTISNLIRMVSKITDKKKIYFSAYPSEKEKFNINLSDSFARSSESLLETLSKLFVENKEPKDVGVSRLSFQMVNSLLKILNGKFIVTSDANEQKDCAFSFPMKLTSEIEPEEIEVKPETPSEIVEEVTEQPEIIETESSVETVEKETFESDPFEQKFEEPIVTDEVISKKQPEPFFEKEEIEIEEEIVDREEHTLEQHIEPPIEKQEIDSEQTFDEPVPEEEITIDETPPVNENNYLSNLNCLYIEDQVDSQILFKVQMKGLKNIQFAASFEEAVPLLKTNKFDFIVMDINLQGEYNGLDALKAIHQMQGFENIPIIAVTAYVLPGDREKFIATGFNDFISKPIFREKMYESLKKIFVN
jgi:CheY-like chemotaxis protein